MRYICTEGTQCQKDNECCIGCEDWEDGSCRTMCKECDSTGFALECVYCTVEDDGK